MSNDGRQPAAHEKRCLFSIACFEQPVKDFEQALGGKLPGIRALSNLSPEGAFYICEWPGAVWKTGTGIRSPAYPWSQMVSAGRGVTVLTAYKIFFAALMTT